MTTNLTFTTSATETLPGGTYNISENAGYPHLGPLDATLNFTRPATIENDAVNGGSIDRAAHASQTLNFKTMNLRGELSTGWNDNVVLNGNNLVNNGTISAGSEPGVAVTINTKLLGGHGMEFITGGGFMMVNGRVGGGQFFEDGGGLIIGNPGEFHGHVNLTGFVDLVGLVADSYDYHNDVLRLWTGNTHVDRLDVTAGSGINVYQNSSGTPFAPAGVVVTSNPYEGYGQTALPQHVVGV
jgi:hypothetical protein